MSATWSQAVLSISSAPSTDCSASRECGGTSPSAPALAPSRRERRGVLTRPRPPASARFFRDDDDRQLDLDVGVQMQLHHVLAYGTQWTARQTHFAARERMAGRGGRLGDIGRTDRTEQLSLGSGLGDDRELEILDRRGALLRSMQVLVRHTLELGATGIEARDVLGGRERRLALGQQ